MILNLRYSHIVSASHCKWYAQFELWLIWDVVFQLWGELHEERTVLTIKLSNPSVKMALSMGRCPKWPIWQGELGQRTEDSQIIHKHNGHQYWKDDRWDCRQRPGFNFYSFFFFLQETISLFTKSFVSHKADEEKPSSSKSEPRAVVLVTQMTKMNQARGNNDCDINNDAIRMLGGIVKETKHSPCRSNLLINIFKKALFIIFHWQKDIKCECWTSLTWLKVQSENHCSFKNEAAG